ncbi:MAG: hypothetical protein IKB25_06220 [Lentisphaeria bacterium]|nr:hypothetical protein [Lentisphaeria bacterium]
MADSQTICPFCNDTILIPEEFFGSDVECPNCHKQFFIPKVTEVEAAAGSIDSPAMGEFDCPLCGAKNQIPENFSGKMNCKACSKEIEVINEAMIPCPYCGKLIASDDTTCIFCQRSLSDSPQKNEDESQPAAVDPAAQTANLEPLQEPEKADQGDKEDNSVLRALQILKIVLISIFAFIFTSGILVIIFDTKEWKTALSIIFTACYATVFGYLILCWLRGIYKNVMRIRIALEKTETPEDLSE